MVSPARRTLVDGLSEYDRLVEVGVGNRPGVALALAKRGCRVVAVDVDLGDKAQAAARETRAGTVDGSLRVRREDVLALAEDAVEGDDRSADAGEIAPVDAVYACHLPAELQRPTVALADRLDAACVFTTLGFEEPILPVRRRSVAETTLYVARESEGGERRSGPG